ncbi:MAG: preprotein translocase subunit SecE [Acidobacteriaceae bacterium]|nr:preprotein translocase subunit SecE [Acidobacteriaceae bacterium]
MSNVAVETHEVEVAAERALSGPQRLMQFFRDTRNEMHKVVTPTSEDVKNGTLIVLATVFIFALYFWLVDAVIGQGIDKLFLHLTKH